MNSSGTTDYEKLAKVLERHLSPMNARTVLRQSLSEHRLTHTRFTLRDLGTITQSIERGLRLFTAESVSNRAIADITALKTDSGRPQRIEPCTIEIKLETDITRARSMARAMCEQSSAKGFTVQKVTTIVSELARNIVSYTPGGKIDLAVRDGRRARMVIRAVDRGSGIPNLSIIMSGEYRSRTGLGRGIVGTKRLADHFDINTGEHGTQILAEVEL